MKYPEILNENLPASAWKLKLGHGWILQQNNVKTYTQNRTKWLRNHKIKLSTWPLQSTDVNATVHMGQAAS